MIAPAVGVGAQQTPVSWKVESRTGGDGGAELVFTASVLPDWYIYSVEATDGPLPTAVTFAPSEQFETVGALTELGKAKEKYDEGFGVNVKIFEHEAQFVQKINVKSGGDVAVSGKIAYQLCTESANDGRPACFFEEEDFATKITVAAPHVGGGDAGKSLWMFLLLAFAAGLGAVFTPCVFPMIPMTVSFFIMGNGAQKKTGVARGLIFGISVAAIYTLVGLLAAIFKSADAADVLASHWIPNLVFALLFITFSLSFFGAFDIVLPTGIANKADRQADRSGAFGAFFVAAALVIVSFSCTGPFVGSILVEAMSGGIAVKPVLGMMVFGAALASPFVLFAFFPQWIQKMPRPGSWLNMVKVVFAFILIAFSLKYLSAVDRYFGWHILSREVFIAVWIVCAALLGAYLLGRFRLPHDSESAHVSVPRLLLAAVSFTFALYLLPGLFGAPLSALSGIVPEAAHPSVLTPTAGNTGAGAYEQGLCGAAKYSAPNHRLPYGLPAYHDVDEALACAKVQQKPVLLVFKFDNCSVCKRMESNVWSNEQVLDLLRRKVVIAALYVDDNTELPENEWVTSAIDGKVKKTLGRKLRDYQMSRFGVSAQPFYALVGHDGETLAAPIGESSVEEFLQFLNDGIGEGNVEWGA
jgi:thiol:disulfide interchange protein DsbD